MKKNFKKCLSYVLGVVLAMGLGLSYAYAVGANDSNAFVTTTEWEQRVAQIEASLDNVNKTINDTNMDFVMNGPRLQTSLMEGFENYGGHLGIRFFNSSGGQYRSSTLNSTEGKQFYFNHFHIQDQFDGRQSLRPGMNFYRSDTNNGMVTLRGRFAVKTNDPNIYLIVSLYCGDYRTTAPHYWQYLSQVMYIDMANPYTNYSTAKTVEVTLPLSEWWPIVGDAAPTAQSRNSNYIYTGRIGTDVAFPYYLYWGSGNTYTTYNLSNPGTGYVTRSVTSTDVTFRYEFPANANIIRECKAGNSPGAWDILPIHMNGRKFATFYDSLYNSFSTTEAGKTERVIAKVYSPQKGCLALKSYINGEIPILNE